MNAWFSLFLPGPHLACFFTHMNIIIHGQPAQFIILFLNLSNTMLTSAFKVSSSKVTRLILRIKKRTCPRALLPGRGIELGPPGWKSEVCNRCGHDSSIISVRSNNFLYINERLKITVLDFFKKGEQLKLAQSIPLLSRVEAISYILPWTLNLH